MMSYPDHEAKRHQIEVTTTNGMGPVTTEVVDGTLENFDDSSVATSLNFSTKMYRRDLLSSAAKFGLGAVAGGIARQWLGGGKDSQQHIASNKENEGQNSEIFAMRTSSVLQAYDMCGPYIPDSVSSVMNQIFLVNAENIGTSNLKPYIDLALEDDGNNIGYEDRREAFVRVYTTLLTRSDVVKKLGTENGRDEQFALVMAYLLTVAHPDFTYDSLNDVPYTYQMEQVDRFISCLSLGQNLPDDERLTTLQSNMKANGLDSLDVSHPQDAFVTLLQEIANAQPEHPRIP